MRTWGYRPDERVEWDGERAYWLCYSCFTFQWHRLPCSWTLEEIKEQVRLGNLR